MDMGMIRIIDPVIKFSIPFLVEASFTRLALEPVVFWREPSVKNLKRGPRALVIAVLIGVKTSSDWRTVGAVTIWSVVDVSMFL